MSSGSGVDEGRKQRRSLGLGVAEHGIAATVSWLKLKNAGAAQGHACDIGTITHTGCTSAQSRGSRCAPPLPFLPCLGWWTWIGAGEGRGKGIQPTHPPSSSSNEGSTSTINAHQTEPMQAPWPRPPPPPPSNPAIFAESLRRCGTLIHPIHPPIHKPSARAHPPTQPKPTNTHSCAACHRVNYCSQTCQTTHWRAEHKQQCKAWKREREQVSTSLGIQGNTSTRPPTYPPTHLPPTHPPTHPPTPQPRPPANQLPFAMDAPCPQCGHVDFLINTPCGKRVCVENCSSPALVPPVNK